MSLHFEPVDIHMKPVADKYIKAWHLDGSEYTFTNLFIWGDEGRIKLAEYDDTLFILLTYENMPEFMFAPLTLRPDADYRRALRIAEEYFSSRGVAPAFHAISGPLKGIFERCAPEYTLEDDRENYDYIYDTNALIELKGRHYHAKRNHLNRFFHDYDFEYVDLRPSMLEECIGVYMDWLKDKDIFQPFLLGEMAAIERIITHMDVLGVRGGGIRIRGALKAFTLGERVDETMAVIHIEKADDKIEGLYTAINQQFVAHCWQDTVRINREEDMGIEGLRRAKLSYRPVMLLEKLIARRK